MKSVCRRQYTVIQKKKYATRAHEMREQGHSWPTIAEALGVHQSNLIRWVERYLGTPKGRFLPAVVPVQPATTTCTLVSPGGFRIENLSRDDAVAIVKALS